VASRFLSRSAALLAVALAALAAGGADLAAARNATTTLFSRSVNGGTPNGASTNAVISGDLRYAQIIAYESTASNLVRDDTNGFKDVFAVRRAGSFGNNGSAWKPGATQLVSQGLGGAHANGPSFSPSVDGNASHRATCVAFLSDASNLVEDDTNGVTDAFLAKAPGFSPRRVSLPDNAQSTAASTAVAVSGDCSRVAFVAGGKLYVRTGSSTKALSTKANPADPSFATGATNDLVFGASGGVYLSSGGTGNPKLVAAGGRNPGFVNRVRRVVVYERSRSGHVQIFSREIGKGEKLVSGYKGHAGNKDSRGPSVFNQGLNFEFESDATNLPLKVSGEKGDRNGKADAYFFTAVGGKNSTIIESVDSSNNQFKAGGRRPSSSYLRNYVVFDSSGNAPKKPAQVYLRYLGGI
jgi:hypothetical protein